MNEEIATKIVSQMFLFVSRLFLFVKREALHMGIMRNPNDSVETRISFIP